MRVVVIHPQIQGAADTAPAKLPENLEAGQMQPLVYLKLLKEQELCTDLVTKGVKSSEKTKPFPVEWLLEEWENPAQREALLLFYYSSVKVKLCVQGTHAAVLFSTFNLTLLFMRDKEEALLAVQLKGDILSRESD